MDAVLSKGRRTHRRPLRIGALAFAGALFAGTLSACSSGGGSSASSSGSKTPTTISYSSVSNSDYHPVTNYAAYVGNPKLGKANPKLSTIDIGVFNEQGGALDIAPQWTVGQTVGADYLNNVAGGIDGHPVKLVECFSPDTVSQATSCGQQFANDSSIPIVDMGAVVIGNQAFESALQPVNKPITYSVATGGPDASYPDGYIFMGDSTHVEAQWATALQILGTKYGVKPADQSVSIVWDSSEGTAAIDITIDALKYIGIPASNIHSVEFQQGTTDFTTPLEASQAGHTDFLIVDGSNTDCADAALAIKQLGITEKLGIGTNAPCDSTQTAVAEGGSLPKNWYYLTANPLNGDQGDPSIPAIHKVFAEFGQSAWAADAWAGDSFGQILTSAKWLSEALQKGEALTSANVNAIGKAFKGPVAQGAPELNCGGFPKAPAVCNDRVSFFKNTVPATATSPGVMVPLARWVTPPDGFTIPLNLL